MIPYTPNQIYDLLGSVKSKKDVQTIGYYLSFAAGFYSHFDMAAFNTTINDLLSILK